MESRDLTPEEHKFLTRLRQLYWHDRPPIIRAFHAVLDVFEDGVEIGQDVGPEGNASAAGDASTCGGAEERASGERLARNAEQAMRSGGSGGKKSG